MPHVIVKLYSGRSEQEKSELAQRLSEAVMTTLGYGEEAVSVAIEDIEPRDWASTVYQPDIIAKPDKIYKQPGYTM